MTWTQRLKKLFKRPRSISFWAKLGQQRRFVILRAPWWTFIPSLGRAWISEMLHGIMFWQGEIYHICMWDRVLSTEEWLELADLGEQ